MCVWHLRGEGRYFFIWNEWSDLSKERSKLIDCEEVQLSNRLSLLLVGEKEKKRKRERERETDTHKKWSDCRFDLLLNMWYLTSLIKCQNVNILIYFLNIFFLVSARFLCWDCWNSTWLLHLTQPCYVALGWVLIWVISWIGLRQLPSTLILTSKACIINSKLPGVLQLELQQSVSTSEWLIHHT